MRVVKLFLHHLVIFWGEGMFRSWVDDVRMQTNFTIHQCFWWWVAKIFFMSNPAASMALMFIERAKTCVMPVTTKSKSWWKHFSYFSFSWTFAVNDTFGFYINMVSVLTKIVLHSVVSAIFVMSLSCSSLESTLVRISLCDSDVSPTIKIRRSNWLSVREFSLNFSHFRFTIPVNVK